MKDLIKVGTRIALTTGRFNPLHLAHQKKVFTPMLQITSPKFVNEGIPGIFIMGSSNDDRNLDRNPFNYDQRVDMAQIAIADLLQQNDMKGILTEENQKKLNETGKIDWLIKKEVSFPRHCDNKESNSPPKLDSLADFLKEHCNKYNLPLTNLFSYISVKPGELGREYQLYGKKYEYMHQMTAVANAFEFERKQDVIEFDQGRTLIGSTEIRNNLSENFSYLSPKIFKYVQQELAKALLNNRRIGDDNVNDKAVNVSDFVTEINKSGKILSFSDAGYAKVISVSEELFVSFLSHVIRSEGPGTSPQAISENIRLKQEDINKTHT